MKETECLRNYQQRLICKQDLINEMIEEFDKHYDGYLEYITYVFRRFKISSEPLNKQTEKLFIGEEGICG